MSTAHPTWEESRTSPAIQATQPAWLDRTVYPFQSRYLTLDGHRIHYIDQGSGPLLLFLHANPLWSFQYRHIIKALQVRFRCIALDYPGFGLSKPRPGFVTTLAAHSLLIEHFIQALDLHEITLVAHDASVSIGLGVVTRQPARFSNLIISNGFAWPLSDDPSINRFLKFVASPFFRFAIVNCNLLMRWTVANLKGLSETERRAYLAPHAGRDLRRHQHDFFRTIVGSDAYLQALKQQLPALAHFPVLLLFADNDPTYRAGWMQRYERIFPNHRSVRIEGSHHFPQEYNPGAMVKAIDSWWQLKVAAKEDGVR